MKKIYKAIFICFFLLAVSISNKSFATTYTWTGGSGTWDQTNTSNWLPQGVPGYYDTAMFNSSSFTAGGQAVTIQGKVTCGYLIMNGIKNNPTFTSGVNDTLQVNSSIHLEKNCIWAVGGLLHLSNYSQTDTAYINTNGVSVKNVLIETTGAPHAVISQFDVLSLLNLNYCTLIAKNQQIHCKDFKAAQPSAYVYLFGKSKFLIDDSFSGNYTNFYMEQVARLIIGNYAKPFNFSASQCNFNYQYNNLPCNGAVEFRGITTFSSSNYSFNTIVFAPGSRSIFPPQSIHFYQHMIAKGTPTDSVYFETSTPGQTAEFSNYTGSSNCLYYVSVSDMNSSSNTIGLNHSKVKTSNTYGWDTTANCKPIQATFTQTSKIYCNGGQGGGYISITSGTGTNNTPVYLWSDPTISTSTSSTTNLLAGTYTVDVSDYSDTAKVVFTLSEPAPLKVKINPKDIACYGDSTGLAVITITGGTSPYTANTFSWNIPQGSIFSANKDTISKITPYTVYIEFRDSNYCYTNTSYTFKQPTNPLSATLSTNNASCYSACDGSIYANISGGWAPYAYSWSNKENSNKAAQLCGGQQYILTTTDSLGCSRVDTATVLNVGTPAQLSGTIYHQTTPVDGATVSLLQYDSAAHMTFVKNHVTQNGGQYLFDTVPVGEVVLRVMPPIGGLYVNDLPSYYTSSGNPAYLWDSASHFAVQCYDVLTNYDINLFTITPQSGGLGKISGRIKEGVGFVSARILQAGQGIPGVNVGLKKKPGGQVVASTFSDTTQVNEGYYEFNGLPDGDYEIYADIPGLPQETTYDVTINGDVYNNLDFVADSAHIKAEYGVGIAKSKTNINGLNLYPNPFNSTTTIEIAIAKNEAATVELYNMLGVKCGVIYNGLLTNSTNYIALNPEKMGLTHGAYLLKYTTDHETKILKINYIK